jgi:hypothetical protein
MLITHPRKSTLTTLIQFILIGTVGIAVIAILLPVFAMSHEACVRNVQSRLHDMSSAMQEYSEENDGLFPSGSYSFHLGGRRSLTGLGWAGQIYPYVMSATDFDDAMGQASGDSSTGHSVAFGINQNAVRNERPSTWNDRSRTVLLFQVLRAHAKIDEPGEGDCSGPGACSPSGNGTMIMLMDGLFPRQVEPATGDTGARKTDPMSVVWPAPEIDGGSYYLMADGHIAWFKPSQVSSGTDAVRDTAAQTGIITGHAAGTYNFQYKATFSTK